MLARFVWQAAGMVMGATGQSNDNALALLRGAAYSAGTTLDELAYRLVTGDLTIDALR